MFRALLQGEAYLVHMQPWFEATFAMNLAYSILVKFGAFTGRTLRFWAGRERNRVSLALVETTDFNVREFERDIKKRIVFFQWIISFVNTVILVWALTASVVIFVLLLYSGFRPHDKVTLTEFWILVVLIAGAVPLGLVTHFILNLAGRATMKIISWRSDGMVRFMRRDRTDRIEVAWRQLKTLQTTAPSSTE